MVAPALGGAAADVDRCIEESLECQAHCEAEMERLAELGWAADSNEVRLLRQCAELCALNARALLKESRLARRTVTIAFDLCNQVARAAWLESTRTTNTLARSAIRAARACRPLLFAT